MKKSIIALLLIAQSSFALATEFLLSLDDPREGMKQMICHDAKAELTGVACINDAGQTDFYPMSRIIKIEKLTP